MYVYYFWCTVVSWKGIESCWIIQRLTYIQDGPIALHLRREWMIRECKPAWLKKAITWSNYEVHALISMVVLWDMKTANCFDASCWPEWLDMRKVELSFIKYNSHAQTADDELNAKSARYEMYLDEGESSRVKKSCISNVHNVLLLSGAEL